MHDTVFRDLQIVADIDDLIGETISFTACFTLANVSALFLQHAPKTINRTLLFLLYIDLEAEIKHIEAISRIAPHDDF